ncbi:hypothetical protein ACGRHY_18110 [Streptomyces sp. HK10]|uniref:hypothetical protein n=1 Tax=Streptomyces sp. HK10 TaxID=3373255 RepID=UPI003749E8B4
MSHLDEVQRIRVYGRDDGGSGLDRIRQDLLGLPPEQPERRITPEFSRHVLPRLLETAGIRQSTGHLRFGDAWRMRPHPLDAGPSWEDRLAGRDDGLVREERLASADEFPGLLDAAEPAAVLPDSPASVSADPLEAQPGQTPDAEWTVRRVLGTGATARALLVERPVHDAGEAGIAQDAESAVRTEERVLKVALDDDEAERLRAEEHALRLVGGGAAVQLRDEGPLSHHELERFGEDLFQALDQLAANGVRHRDIVRPSRWPSTWRRPAPPPRSDRSATRTTTH